MSDEEIINLLIEVGLPWFCYGFVTYIFGIIIMKMIQSERKKPIKHFYFKANIIFVMPFLLIGVSKMFDATGATLKQKLIVFSIIILSYTANYIYKEDVRRALYRKTGFKIFYDPHEDQ